MTKKNIVQFNVRITPEEMDILNEFCEDMNLSKADAVKLALNKLFEETESLKKEIANELSVSEREEFYKFIIDRNDKRTTRIGNVLFRHNIDTMKKFAEMNPLELLDLHGISFMTATYIFEKHSEARKILELPEIEKPSFEEISERIKEKNEKSLRERRIWNGWYEGAD